MGILKFLKRKLINYLTKDESEELFAKISSEINKPESENEIHLSVPKTLKEAKFQALSNVIKSLHVSPHFFLLLLKRLELKEEFEDCCYLREFIADKKWFIPCELRTEQEKFYLEIQRLESAPLSSFEHFLYIQITRDIGYAENEIYAAGYNFTFNNPHSNTQLNASDKSQKNLHRD